MIPEPFTLRELAQMAEGRGRLEWNQTAWILAQIHNANRAPGSTAAKAEDYNPYELRKRKAAKPVMSDFGLLRSMVLRGK